MTKTAAMFLTVMPAGAICSTHAQHDIGEHLGGEDRLLLISRAVESDDQAVADERIFTHSLDGGDLANTHAARGGRSIGG